MNELERFCADVYAELCEMRRVGGQISASMLHYAENQQRMADFINMSVRECASLIVELHL